ncbi:hypothetical protein HY086_05205 [Candidatus Gottesmanbacteria bacterium]|nr:hypothetical protein [Candidatus Gottesmanbacteria bacterium]
MLPKYKYLITYRYSEIIHDLTVEFCQRFLGDLKEKPSLPTDPETAANLLLTLCHMATYLLSRQIQKAEEIFVAGGGYTENLFKKRLQARI